MNKKCSKCGEIKPIDAFHIKKGKKDGHDYRCKECRKKYQSENSDHISKYHKEYYAKNRSSIIERVIEYTKNNREKVIEAKRRYYYANRGPLTRTKKPIDPMKVKARHKVNHAIEYGKIQKPSAYLCSICNEKQAIHYHHHKGYDECFWLDVIPVCAKCHKKVG